MTANMKGFTLIEVIVAVFVLALMSMMIWQITDNAYRGSEKAVSYDKIYQYGRVSLKKLSDDLSSAFLAGPAFQGKLSDGTTAIETSFVGEDISESDAVNFVTFSRIRLVKDEKKSDQAEVGYYIADCPDTEEEQKCLMRRESFMIDKEPKEGGGAFPIAKGVKRFNLEYYDTNKQEWRGDWNSNDPVFLNKLPRAARITLAFPHPKDEDEEIVFTTAVGLPLSSGVINF